MKQAPESMSLSRVMLNGAITLYEAEGQMIAEMLEKQNNRMLFNAFTAIGSTLYWVKDQIEMFMIPMATKE
jgi:hypothetical protein